MRYEAASLAEIYSILAVLPGPLAVIDFMVGELGYEILSAQFFGPKFYQKWRGKARVVALCWKGCCLIYDNVSDDQIEFVGKEAVMGNLEKDAGCSRFRWLMEMRHEKRVAAIPGVAGHFPPTDARNKRLFHDHGVIQSRLFTEPIASLAETQFVFRSPEKRLVQGDYIALYCRNVPESPQRNTAAWQIRLFQRWADQFGVKLVAVMDLWPMELPEGAIRIEPVCRDLDLICNVVHHSLLYGAPGSGAGELAALFGCNFVALGKWPGKGNERFVGEMVECRGFRYFGVLGSPDCQAARNVETYLGNHV